MSCLFIPQNRRGAKELTSIKHIAQMRYLYFLVLVLAFESEKRLESSGNFPGLPISKYSTHKQDHVSKYFWFTVNSPSAWTLIFPPPGLLPNRTYCRSLRCFEHRHPWLQSPEATKSTRHGGCWQLNCMLLTDFPFQLDTCGCFWIQLWMVQKCTSPFFQDLCIQRIHLSL